MTLGFVGLQPRAGRRLIASLSSQAQHYWGSTQRHRRAVTCKARVWELRWLGALQRQTPPCLYAWGGGADLGKWAPRTFRWLMEKGCWLMMCKALQGEACPGRGRAGRKDRFGDSLMSPCNLGEPVGGFIIDWHQAEMPANCLQISHNCRRNKEQTG